MQTAEKKKVKKNIKENYIFANERFNIPMNFFISSEKKIFSITNYISKRRRRRRKKNLLKKALAVEMGQTYAHYN